MKKNYIIFSGIFLLFFIFGLILFYKSIKEIKEVEKEMAFKPPEIEEKREIETFAGEKFMFKDLEGKIFDLKDFKGKYVFLTFWATWCRFCGMELPQLEKIYPKYKDKIEFILISNEEIEKVLNYKKRNNFNLPFYLQSGRIPQKFQTQGIPVNFILNEKGEIIKKVEGYFDWASEEGIEILNKIIKENENA